MKFQGLQILESGEQTIVSFADALAQLHVDEGFDDAKVRDCIDAALDFAETYLWQSLRPQTILASYSPDGQNYAELIRANFDEIVEVSYFDGKQNAIDISTVAVDDTLPVARAYFAEPKVSGEYFAPVKITYKTKAPAVVPLQVKQAILIATAQFYDDRDAPDLSAAERILNLTKTRYLL